MAQKAAFVIGGYIAYMTQAQADRWNRGTSTRHDLRTVEVGLPDEYEQDSHVCDGEIVMSPPRMVASSRTITLARALNSRLSPETEEAMAGQPAYRCGEWQ